VLDVRFNPTGTVLASASKDHTIRLWEPTVQGKSRVIKAHSGPVRSGTVHAAQCL
jgi:centriolar protein POC1